MPRDGLLTRNQIVAAADELFYSQGLHAVSVDAIAEKAGVTKKTFYYHFKSKDDLIGCYLDARDRPTVDRFKEWAGSEGSVTDRMTRFFSKLGRSSQGPRWNGCGFLRAVACRGRQRAGNHADGEEREQRDPVLRIGNRERAKRRHEEGVQA